MKSVFLHLRLPFSLLLLPVFLFALFAVSSVNTSQVLLVFIILHLFIYPASNGYNSYFDKDEGSIALIKNPPKVKKSLYQTAIFLEWTGVFLALFINLSFAACVIIYNLLSKAYSHPSVRLKKYPIISFLVVFIFQGFFVYFTCFVGFGKDVFDFNLQHIFAALICSCLIGASYPLTQIYQFEEDASRGDKTLSMLLGYKGSFIFSALVFLSGIVLVYKYWDLQNTPNNFYVFAACCVPIFIYFIWWFFKVIQNKENANFTNAMRMTLLSGFIMLCYFSWINF
jgi:1,4-dihydroxy-2-naphthoate octaprenyltransferase